MVGAQDVDDDVRTEFGEMILADHRIVVSGQDVVESRFVLHQLVDARPVFQGP